MKLAEECPVLILKKGSRYIGVIKEMALLEEGDTPSDAYEKVWAKRTSLLEKYSASNLDFLLDKETSVPQKPRPYSLNLIVVCLFLTIPILSIMHPLTSLLISSKQAIQRGLALSPDAFVIKLGRKIQNTPEEKKREIREALQIIAAELETYKPRHSEPPSSQK